MAGERRGGLSGTDSRQRPIGAGRAALLSWYEPRRRAYPWRRGSDPYRVLVSEVMLQQTQASRVAPAFESFVAEFPSVGSLAAAPVADVLRAWGGLGYNRRALALHRAVRAIVRDHGGVVPSDPAILETLPGVGPYTAAAVASLGFGARVAAVDVNVRRVVTRALGGAGVEALAGRWLDRDDPGAWNQALMDLGREVCRPIPRCSACPIAHPCRFRNATAGATTADGRPDGTPRSPRRQPPFPGSSREVRGAVVRILLDASPSTLHALARRSGLAPERIVQAVAALHREGMVVAGPGALRGRPRGSVRLPN